MAGVASFVTHAVTDLVRDPLRTSEEAVGDILGVGKDAAESVGQLVEVAEDLVGLGKKIFQMDDDDSNIVTSSQTSGYRPRPCRPARSSLTEAAFDRSRTNSAATADGTGSGSGSIFLVGHFPHRCRRAASAGRHGGPETFG
jgi:hypothetical protein